jgi:hypothetical protein
MIRLVNYAARFNRPEGRPSTDWPYRLHRSERSIKSHVRALAVGRCMIKSER